MRAPQKRRRSPPISKTTIRDFGGGLNTIDTELNLTSRFSPIFDNTVRYADGSVSPRFGYEMWVKLKTGVETAYTLPVGATVDTTNLSRVVIVNWVAHPFSNPSSEHVTFSGFPAINGISAASFNRTHSVRYINANSFAIYVRIPATSTASGAIAGFSATKDTHALGGAVVEGFYFDNFLIVVGDTGEIVRVAEDKSIQRLWDYTIANALGGSPAPWSTTLLVARDYWAGQVILSNGLDKPLRIDFSKTNKVDYMVDPAMASSNVAIPAFDLAKTAFKYFIVHDSETTSTDVRTTVRITSKNTSVVFSGSTPPGDAVDVDVSKIIANSNSTITGLAVIKDKLMVIMPTATILLQLGVYVGAIHEPAPADTMPNFGTSSRRSIVEVGNDVFMLDYTGVPSARLSSLQNTVVPERVSQLIEPTISKHISRLSQTTISTQAFGVYDTTNKSIQFVLPKYDAEDVRSLQLNPFSYSSLNENTNSFIAFVQEHQFELGDIVRVSGATAFGQLSVGELNADHTVVGILSEDVVVLDYVGDVILSGQPQSGGGPAVEMQPINDQSVIFTYHYVPSLKINSWSRFKSERNRLFVAGCTSALGKLFTFTDDSVYRYGTVTDPVYGDSLNDFDATWALSTAYVIGQRIRDAISGEVFICDIAHTSPASGTFAAARENAPLNWLAYEGEPIEQVWELPWADFGVRQELKALKAIHIDAMGQGQFTVQAFVDNIYRNGALGELSPVREIQFTCGDSAGYGAGDQPYGAGRRTREQFLWPFPVRFKILKLRITSNSTRSIRISAISFLYQRGGVVRA